LQYGSTSSRNEAVSQYLPAIKAILASVEVGLATYPVEKMDHLQLAHLHAEFAYQKSPMPLTSSTCGSKILRFEATSYFLKKHDSKATWEDMMTLLRERLAEYDTAAPIVEIVLSSSGKISREVGGQRLLHEFEAMA